MKTKMKHLANTVVTLFIFSIPFLAVAQDKDFENFIDQTFETKLNQAAMGNNTKDLLKSFDEGLIWIDINVSIDGRIAGKKGSKETLAKHIKRVASSPNLNIVWKISKYNQVSVRENTLLANFEVDVSLFAKGELISEGRNMVDVLAKKVNDTYVVTYLSILQVANKTYKGRCFVDIVKGDNGYTTQTSFPNGTVYQTTQNDIAIVGSDKLRVVKLNQGEETYYWNTVLGIVTTDKQGKLNIGNAKDETNVVLVILKNQNTDKCTNMIPTKIPNK